MSDDEDDAEGEGTFEKLMRDIAETDARGFEHRCVFSMVQQRLLGTDTQIYIGNRYRVIRRLGAGGMGEIYLCQDEQLGRSVAVKRVRGSGGSRDQARLRREAQTLAALSHPNLVVAYDVGEHDGQTFLAMEYIEGQTLERWLQHPRPWREVLGYYVAAGRGLAAAHRAGVIHRDFKPDNVLLGQDGTVKVADFGLALGEEQVEPLGADWLATLGDSPDSRSSKRPLPGTPRYMGLEQLEGLTVDFRSDQFSFCVALYEGLWGELPFTDGQGRREALLRGQPKVPRHGHGLWRPIRRGLARDPDQRWPSMDALLHALEQVTVRRQWFARTTVAFGLGLAIALVVVESGGSEVRDACEGVERELDGVWDAHRRDELEQQFATLDAGHAADSAQHVLEGLDGWAIGWLAEREQVCRTRGTRTEDRSVLLLQCLDRQREHVEVLVEMLVEADASTLAEAVVIVAELPESSSCLDEPPSPMQPPPPALAARVAEARQDIARARELRRLGRLQQAHEFAQDADLTARQIEYGPLQAEARAELAMAEDEAGSPLKSAELYEEAIDLAEIHHHDRLAAQLWIERAELSLFDLRDPKRGEIELHRGAIAYERAKGADTWASARLSFGRGRLAKLSRDRAGAEASYREAVSLAREAESSDLPAYLDALARVVESSEEALALRSEAVEFARTHWGPRHPRTANPTFELGQALLEMDRGGERELESAVAIWTEVHQRPHPKLAKAHSLLGRQALLRGDLDQAEAHAQSMAAIQDQVLGERDPDRGEPEQLLATIEGVRGNPEAALAHAHKALAFFELAGPEDPGAWSMQQLVIDQLLALGRLDETAMELERLRSIQDSDPDRASFIHLKSAELAVRRNRLRDADLQLQAVATVDHDLGDHELTFEVLRALVDLRLNRLEPAQAERVRSAREHSDFTDAQLSTWFEDLEVTPNERRRLALN